MTFRSRRGYPPGHGHKYTGEYVDGWNATMRPTGLSSDNLDAIRTAISKDE